ncbi:CWF19-like protein 1 isoform X2 [Mya arenaria]|nr:CWF19-like protein 1 isoform X2 [Mya arenaria]
MLVLGPNQSEHVSMYADSKGGDLCENITFLGKKGIYSGSSGLQLAYLSGKESDIISDDTSFNAVDLSALIDPVKNDTKFKGVDILINSQWPKGVEKYGTEVPGFKSDECGSEAISQLALGLRPRYHFCGLEGVHYERPPYRNHKVLAEPSRHVTRFIALANVGNTKKHKYLYAFNITPLSDMEPADLNSQPQDVTECPYNSKAFQSQQPDTQAQQFFYATQEGGKKRPGKAGGDRPQKKHKPVSTGPCWFCLGSPEVEKHLVVSVGEETYLALAKGGLVADHILILPIGHYQSSVTAPEEVINEIDKYKKSLKKYFKKQGKAVVFFERNFKTQHLQIQAVPVPNDCIQEVKDTFMECAEEEGIEINEIPTHSDIKQIAQIGVPYFYAELPIGEKMFCRIQASKKFPLQFGREVLASPSILDMTERVDWKVCNVAKHQETEMAATFKEKFKKYDFTLDE